MMNQPSLMQEISSTGNRIPGLKSLTYIFGMVGIGFIILISRAVFKQKRPGTVKA